MASSVAQTENRPRLKTGQSVNSKTVRYTLQRKLGNGRFGCAFEVLNERNEVFAMKVEWKCADRNDPRLGMEIAILRHIRQNTVSPHFIDYVDRASKPNYFFMVTSLVGQNLETLMHEQDDNKFTHRTALGIALQVLDALKDLHMLGYIHRDVRPRNLCIGLGDKTHNIFLMNFGSAAIYQKAKKIRKPRENVAIRGKIEFTSLSSHEHVEQSPKDDIESLIYTIVYFCNGLPWNEEKNADSVASQKKKLREDSGTFFRMIQPQTMASLLAYLDKLTYYERLDHEYVKNLIMQAAAKEKIQGIKSEFDWECDTESSESSSSVKGNETSEGGSEFEKIVFEKT